METQTTSMDGEGGTGKIKNKINTKIHDDNVQAGKIIKMQSHTDSCTDTVAKIHFNTSVSEGG